MNRLWLALLVLVAAACSDKGFVIPQGTRRLVVDLVAGTAGSPVAPQPLTIDTPLKYSVKVHALLPDGSVDTAFTSYVRLSAKPGSIAPLTGEGGSGRNVLLVNGESQVVDVQLTNGFGTTYILADDLGYIPADPLRQPPPQCSDGIDNDGNGLVDFPADPGCAFANDDSELGGSYEQGASPPITFNLPRIADVRGLKCLNGTCSSSGISPYQKEQVTIDAGLRLNPDGTQRYAFDLIVTRIAANGYYFQDARDSRGGFNSVFAFNFNAPPGMRVCDYLRQSAGTAGEFFGFTQLSFPTWIVEQWDPSKRPCNVPEPTSLVPETLDAVTLLALSGSLVRAETLNDKNAHIASKLGIGIIPKDPVTKLYVPGVDATNCDMNKDGSIDFSVGAEEGICSNACTADLECIEYSNYAARSSFRIVLTDQATSADVQANGSAAAGFDVIALRGKPIRAFSGTLTYFSGGSQFTIEARCADDIVTDLNATPFPSDKACVLPRTTLELNPE